MGSGSAPTTYIFENLTRNCVLADQVRRAEDSASRRRGLLDINELNGNSGLWINPCEAVHTFGMRIPLDVVFLDRALRVKKIASHLKPQRIAFCLTARSVLEIKAGIATDSGLQCGDQLSVRKFTCADSVGVSRLNP